MNDMKKNLELADNNLIYSIRNRMGHVKDAKFYDEEGYVIFTIGVDDLDGHLNGGICLDDDKAEEFLNKIQSVFSPLKRSYTVWVRDHGNEKLERLLKEKGLKPIREPGSACMICTQKINKTKIPNGYGLRYIDTNDDIERLSKVVKGAFNKNEEISKIMFNLRMVSNPRVKAMIVYEKATDTPVAAATIVSSLEASGIYYLGTVEEYRGQGLGAFITQEATNLGFDSGLNIVILQASEAGERVYSKLGYETISHYRTYRVEL